MRKQTGSAFIYGIIANTIIPCQVFYHQQVKSAVSTDWLNEYDQLASEQNQLINEFKNLGLSVKSRFDSQSLLYMKKNYCDEKKCLECAVGWYWLKQTE